MCAEFLNFLPGLVGLPPHTQKERIGSLELGKEADFVILSCKANAEAMLKAWEMLGDVLRGFGAGGEASPPTQGGNLWIQVGHV